MVRRLEAVEADAEAMNEDEPMMTYAEFCEHHGAERLAQMDASSAAWRRGERAGFITHEEFLPILDSWIAEGERLTAEQGESVDEAL